MCILYAYELFLKFSSEYIHPNYFFYCFECCHRVCPNLSSAPCIWHRDREMSSGHTHLFNMYCTVQYMNKRSHGQNLRSTPDHAEPLVQYFFKNSTTGQSGNTVYKSILFYSILFYSILSCSILFYSILFYSIL
jgi:hypothetical protein